MLSVAGDNTDKKYDLTVWYEPKGHLCAICEKKATHGVGIEGPAVDADVCDDCAGMVLTIAVKCKGNIEGRLR